MKTVEDALVAENASLRAGLLQALERCGDGEGMGAIERACEEEREERGRERVERRQAQTKVCCL
jgi:hypothetical protein